MKTFHLVSLQLHSLASGWIRTIYLRTFTSKQRSWQQTRNDKDVMFWRITNNCQSQVLFLDLPLCRFHNKRQKIFHFQQSNRERVETFSFSNRFDDIIPLLGDKWLNENDPNIKMIFLETFSAECNNFWNSNMTILFIVMIPCNSCITTPLLVIDIHELGSEFYFIWSCVLQQCAATAS